ncbi:diguanylate cyclase [[Enterobacter] lignolyticus]|uniref:Diguanylate cyclase DosC n=2 Tax=[Enterobacter] lignolyticus TaxID=1334193 RepID=E3G434_ENTLS|nr:diguanylate cyclase [[Enterobacter] lignolyticus]ADO47049.1 diguanylate cyclase [[Enterobacter] lignolyticus SCF1]ALR78036.1 diguanylate cyclase [[Enterobacter] lignolyticus]
MEMYLSNMTDEWTNLVENTAPRIRSLASEISRLHAHNLSIEFYNTVLTDPHAEEFLSNEQVERQLKAALARWITDVLSGKTEDVNRLVALQQTVANVHARIGIPVELVEMGFRVLKKLFSQVIIDSECDPSDKLQVYHYVMNSIDLSMEVMSRAFSFSESSTTKEDENYRIFSLLENAEEEKERQTAALLTWEREVVYKVMLDVGPERSLPLNQSDFGLWFNHKGRHYFSGFAEVGLISRLIQELDGFFSHTRDTAKAFSDKKQRGNFLLKVRNTVSQIMTLLRELFEEVARQEVGIDVLTKLLNRRFLPPIFKREVAYASRTGTPLSILVIDVDKFKGINDTWGHHTGDDVLRRISQVFYDNVRSSDYVFRYGGDEFIVMLTEASGSETLQLAERIRRRVEKIKMQSPTGDAIPLSLSIGAAMFSGHPDYEHLIRNADEALYIAKKRGRNCVELWKPTA